MSSQSPLRLPGEEPHRNGARGIGIRLQKLPEPLRLPPPEPERWNEWSSQWFIVIRYIAETGASIASSALIGHNAKHCSEMPNGKFNNLIKEPGIQIPFLSFFFFLIKEKKKKKTGLTCRYTKQRAGKCPKLLRKCCFISPRLLINIL